MTFRSREQWQPKSITYCLFIKNNQLCLHWILCGVCWYIFLQKIYTGVSFFVSKFFSHIILMGIKKEYRMMWLFWLIQVLLICLSEFLVSLFCTHMHPGKSYLLLILSTILAYKLTTGEFHVCGVKVCVEPGAHVLFACWQILLCSSAAELIALMVHSLDGVIHWVTHQVCFALNPKQTHPNKEGAVGWFSYCCHLTCYLRAPTISCWDIDHITILPVPNLPKVCMSSEGTLCSQKCCHSTQDTHLLSQIDVWWMKETTGKD